MDHGVGVGHLIRLLGSPGDSVAATDLDGSDVGDREPESTSARLIDDVAARAYRTRLDQLDADVEADRAEASLLRRQLAANRHVASTSAEIERVRTRVTKALSRAIDDVAAVDPALGAHLRTSVETGRRCIYAPSNGVGWWIVDRTS